MRHLFACLVFLAIASSASAQDLIFVIRVDDIQARTAWTPRSIQAFEEAVQSRGGRITWAVIPHRLVEVQNEDGILAAELRASSGRGHEISVHGYIHICERCGQSSHEMYCTRDRVSFDYSHQWSLLQDAVSILDGQIGAPLRSFVPPGHAMDATTLEVLYDAGFDVISTDAEHGVELRNGVFNVAPSVEYTWALAPANYESEMRRALSDIRAAEGYFNLLLHDPFIREGYEDGLVIRWTAELLDSLNVEYGARIQYMTVTEAADHLRRSETSLLREPEIAGLSIGTTTPNPVVGTAEVLITLPSSGDATIEIVDALGRRLSRSSLGRLAAGSHRLPIEASRLPAGTYFLLLRTDRNTAARPFVVAR
jgi:predicted deacetylase